MPIVVGPRRDALFLDVGVWDTGNTKFGLVCGRYVVLCSWLGEEGVPAALNEDYPEALKAFLRDSQYYKKGKGQEVATRCYVVGDPVRATRDLFDDKAVLVVVPDLHLTLFKDSNIWDRFRMGGASLDEHLAALLELGRKVGAKVYQTGDLFDVWEALAVLMDCWERLRNLQAWGLPNTSQPSWCPGVGEIVERRELPNSTEFVNWCRRLPLVGPPPSEIMAGASFFKNGGAHPGVAREETELIPIDDGWPGRTRCMDAIVRAIKNKYPLLFGPGGNLGMATRLYGNHDNVDRANNYFAPNGFSIKPAVTELPSDGSRFAKEGGVWLEHGDALDPYNNLHVFDRRDALGEHLRAPISADSIVGLFAGSRGFRTTQRFVCDFNKSGVVSKLGDWGYVMRADQLLRVEEIFLNEQDVSLVVMGHTHSAVLSSLPNMQRSFAHQNKYSTLACRELHRNAIKGDQA